MSRDRRHVDLTSPAAVAAWARDARDLTREIRLFAEDATMPSGDRLHARTYLRKMICRRLRELDARIDALTPAPPATDEPAPETKPGGAP
jgi:hypothetical protein